MPAAIIYATGPGGSTLDQDAQGGNPFASALIEAASEPLPSLGALARRVRGLTQVFSQRHQRPDWADVDGAPAWSLHLPPGQRCERRSALLLIVSDYPALQPPRLVGAAFDERRVAAMLAGNGFSVQQGVAPDQASLSEALRSFGARTQACDSALIYATGHGVEHAGEAYLLPGDYPFDRGYCASALRRAVSVRRMARACRAARLNLVLYAACRSRPATG